MPGDKRKKNELDYLLHILLDSRREDQGIRVAAAEQIFGISADRPGSLDEVETRLLAAYPEYFPDDLLAAPLAKILTFHWPDSEWADRALWMVLHAEYFPLPVCLAIIEGLSRRVNREPRLLARPCIRVFVQEAHLLLEMEGATRGRELERAAARFLSSALYYLRVRPEQEDGIRSKAGEQGGAWPSSRRWLSADGVVRRAYLGEKYYRVWLWKLRSLYNATKRSLDARLAEDALHALFVLAGSRNPSFTSTQASLAMRSAFLLILGSGSPEAHIANPGLLARQFEECGRSPAEFLSELLLRDDAEVLLLWSLSYRFFDVLPRLLRQLVEAGALSRLGLHIHPSHSALFRRFLGGGDSVEVTTMLSLPHAGRNESRHEEDREQRAEGRRILREIDAIPGLEFALVGPRLRGLAGLEDQAERIAADVREHPGSRLLLLSYPFFSYEFESTKCDLLLNGRSPVSLSYSPRLAELMPPSRLRSVIAFDEGGCFTSEPWFFGRSDVGEICHAHGLRRSFGFRPQETVLRRQRYRLECDSTYEELWDGVLVLLGEDRDHREREDSPGPPSARTPVASGTGHPPDDAAPGR